MKTQILKTVLALFVSLMLVGCSDDDSNDTNTNNNSNLVAEANQVAQSGSWRISYFWDSNKDETSNFTGYVFNFNSDGTLVATRNNDTVNGTWSVTDSSSSSSSSSNDVDFNIFFNVPQSSDFEDLNDDWDIVSVTNTMIELTDVSGGNGDTDFLTFVKI
ncbi:hypothetical protein [Aureitalea sp. L0-47]|uniref:hypothetical protein n=1 Tax=Aureitalea sp. L0-47 TaxID=2816962 RepID=UPI0022382E2C|nr:hypothetical protein [Aureitalea sp. L0-47]